MKKSLWQQSSAWRWTVILTVVFTICALFGAPWIPISSGVKMARYTAPPPSSTLGSAMITQPNGQQSVGFQTVRQVPAAPGRVVLPATATPKKPGRDTTFDIAVPRPVEIFPSDTELHMIGVYEGALPEGVKEVPWWANCQDKDGKIADPAECHKKYAGLREPREVTVEIRYRAPLVLALMAYEPVIWNIKGEAPSQLQKIILGGYHGQDIRGIEDDVPVDVYSYEASNCRNCRKRSGYFYTYKDSGKEFANAVSQLKTLTGLSSSSFQGSYKARYFSLTPSIVGKSGSREPSTTTNEPVSGRMYSDHITIANTLLPLPAGPWQAIVYTRIPDGKKENTLISMAQIVDGGLKSLFAARAELRDDNSGFADNLSCGNDNNFYEKTVSNTPNGTQLCYWIEHLNSPWQQPLFEMTATKLKAMGVTVPADAINVGFHKATLNTSITAYVYSNPEAESIYTQPSGWHASPWNNSRIHQDPRRQSFMDQQQNWAETWFQFFRLD